MPIKTIPKKSLPGKTGEPAADSAKLNNIADTNPVDPAAVNDNAPDDAKPSAEAQASAEELEAIFGPAHPGKFGEPAEEPSPDAQPGATEPRNHLPGIVDKEPREDEQPSDESDGVELTEDAIARDLVDSYAECMRFDHDVGQWFHWNGNCWHADETGRGFDIARLHCRGLRGDNRQLSTRRSIEGVEMMARRDQRVAVTSNNWDRDPLLLGTPGGVVDLRTGQLQEADPAHFITKLTRVAPAEEGAACSEFMKFLHAATGGDDDVKKLLQQFGGYCLSGLTKEQVLLFIYGPGGNGKSVLQMAFKEILGDYAVTSAMETFAASKQQRHLTELAMLRGARLVGVSETEKEQKWAQARINQLTGGDPITANYMRQDHFTFVPQFKLLIVGNHKPQIPTVNDAARRRFIIVPFLYKPTKPDPQLMDKLRAEYPAVLRWMIDGCLDWQQNGLSMPDVVKEATSEYFEEQDLVGRFIKEEAVCSPELQTPAAVLFEAYKEFAITNGENPGSSTSFGSQLAQHGFKKKKSSTSIYLGIGLKGTDKMQFKNHL
jgi:putative DNA primase/helicase